jgi:hypothetical protein
MSTTNRIVLVDSRGGELFSGDSVLSDAPPTLRIERSYSSAPSADLLVEPDEPEAETPRVMMPRLTIEEIAVEEAERLGLHADAKEHDAVAVEDDEEPIPETLRSSVFVRAHEPVSRPIVIEEDRIVLEEDHRAA